MTPASLRRRAATSLLVGALALAACGGDDDGAGAGDAPSTVADTTAGYTGPAGTGQSDTGPDASGSGDRGSGAAGSGATGSGDDVDGDAPGDGGAGGTPDPAGPGTGATTAPAGGGAATTTPTVDGPFALAAGEKAIPRAALVFVRPVPGAVYTYASSQELGGGTLTYTVTGATETGDGGVDVAVDLTASFATGDVTLGYLFRYLADGSIQVPFVDFSSIGGASGLTLVEQPNFTFLDRPAVDAGTDFSGSTRAAFEISGTRIEATYDYVGRGLPRQSITVPAGTFSVTPIQYDITVSVGGGASAAIEMTSTFYLDDAIGMVSSTFSSDTFGSGRSDLVSCTLLECSSSR